MLSNEKIRFIIHQRHLEINILEKKCKNIDTNIKRNENMHVIRGHTREGITRHSNSN